MKRKHKIMLWMLLREQARQDIIRYKTGLCPCVQSLKNDGLINEYDANYLINVIVVSNINKYMNFAFIWPRGILRPRLKFIDSQIKQLKIESNESDNTI